MLSRCAPLAFRVAASRILSEQQRFSFISPFHTRFTACASLRKSIRCGQIATLRQFEPQIASAAPDVDPGAIGP